MKEVTYNGYTKEEWLRDKQDLIDAYVRVHHPNNDDQDVVNASVLLENVIDAASTFNS